ncbi:hypothetical protein RvY_02694 [Ramazzottius varieornatus]|uniref:Uncharacterized protein n=1 Tax=Ramazzottius varieornatus TaxID=947166 RepID=A0A1D1USN6_RAMVA|nr:hypothetical protein RvY_02694 [Ramazzottius varieornatus]
MTGLNKLNSLIFELSFDLRDNIGTYLGVNWKSRKLAHTLLKVGENISRVILLNVRVEYDDEGIQTLLGSLNWRLLRNRLNAFQFDRCEFVAETSLLPCGRFTTKTPVVLDETCLSTEPSGRRVLDRYWWVNDSMTECLWDFTQKRQRWFVKMLQYRS